MKYTYWNLSKYESEVAIIMDFYKNSYDREPSKSEIIDFNIQQSVLNIKKRSDDNCFIKVPYRANNKYRNNAKVDLIYGDCLELDRVVVIDGMNDNTKEFIYVYNIYEFVNDELDDANGHYEVTPNKLFVFVRDVEVNNTVKSVVVNVIFEPSNIVSYAA
ncbi:hypothetical protein FVR03_17900 [Pontibacter qinzhouensis]|uniref:Uncharacterized protein n=1 Tax=Pontibacter qinzhouensis TaxID=2603253 RepID=A0A5C8JIP7_9BACT|nr:hypothetical protein [Pontibacter qinzhouensis]TXK36427.1 hypothetical protein FVR03_17900 [Pontibacter qinzhouensis]